MLPACCLLLQIQLFVWRSRFKFKFKCVLMGRGEERSITNDVVVCENATATGQMIWYQSEGKQIMNEARLLQRF
jgi:hypothetical protein